MFAESEIEGKENISIKVITSVAQCQETDPLDLPPLIEYVDADSLNRLFTSGTGYVKFQYAGCEVTVDSNGKVEVSD